MPETRAQDRTLTSPGLGQPIMFKFPTCVNHSCWLETVSVPVPGPKRVIVTLFTAGQVLGHELCSVTALAYTLIPASSRSGYHLHLLCPSAESGPRGCWLATWPRSYEQIGAGPGFASRSISSQPSWDNWEPLRQGREVRGLSDEGPDAALTPCMSPERLMSVAAVALTTLYKSWKKYQKNIFLCFSGSGHCLQHNQCSCKPSIEKEARAGQKHVVLLEQYRPLITYPLMSSTHGKIKGLLLMGISRVRMTVTVTVTTFHPCSCSSLCPRMLPSQVRCHFHWKSPLGFPGLG